MSLSQALNQFAQNLGRYRWKALIPNTAISVYHVGGYVHRPHDILTLLAG